MVQGPKWGFNQKSTRVEIDGIPDVPTYNFHVCWESLVSPGNDSAFDGRAEEVIIGDSRDDLEAEADSD
ncbi:hypothetical protein SLA2020_358210 [Shorea laevis]